MSVAVPLMNLSVSKVKKASKDARHKGLKDETVFNALHHADLISDSKSLLV